MSAWLDRFMARSGWIRIEKYDRAMMRITSLQNAVTSLGAEVRALGRQNALLRAQNGVTSTVEDQAGQL